MRKEADRKGYGDHRQQAETPPYGEHEEREDEVDLPFRRNAPERPVDAMNPVVGKVVHQEEMRKDDAWSERRSRAIPHRAGWLAQGRDRRNDQERENDRGIIRRHDPSRAPLDVRPKAPGELLI